jgi:tRNA-binding protein
MTKQISWEEFENVDIRKGTIVNAEPFPQARRPAIIVYVDFGPDLGIKKSSAQITDLYTPDSLIGKAVLGVVNFPPKQIGPIMSECLITGFYNEQKAIVLANVDSDVPNGAKLI